MNQSSEAAGFDTPLRISVLVIFLCLTCAFSCNPGLGQTRGLRVLVDPGHGGSDPGAVSPEGITEKSVNLGVARYLAALLKGWGAETEMTRQGDTYVKLSERRPESFTRTGYQELFKPDLFISIHHNASVLPLEGDVTEVYYQAWDRDISFSLASCAGKNLATALGTAECRVLPGAFGVMRQSPCPALLFEACYMADPARVWTLSRPLGQFQEALAIFSAFQAAGLRPRVQGKGYAEALAADEGLPSAEPVALAWNLPGPGKVSSRGAWLDPSLLQQRVLRKGFDPAAEALAPALRASLLDLSRSLGGSRARLIFCGPDPDPLMILQADRRNDFSYLLVLTAHESAPGRGDFHLTHYYSSTRGKNLAETLAKTLRESELVSSSGPGERVRIMGNSGYFTAFTKSSALVLSVPSGRIGSGPGQLRADRLRSVLAGSLYEAFRKMIGSAR